MNIKTKNSAVLLICILLFIPPCFSQSYSPLNVIYPFATGLTKPVCISHAGDSRLFVVDQHGIIRIVDPSGNVYTQPFLNITDRVVYGGEMGLLGLAFHPQYLTNGYFYVNYIGEGDSTHISRFSVSPGNPNEANPGSELKMMNIYQPFTNHNGGDLKFGPDGYLYIGMGDGGSSGDPGNRAQNPMEYLGKMLRIDVNTGSPYAIPSTNPFYSSITVLNEIWALGLRNPWRFSFDRLNGDLWIADVGQSQMEEIDYQPAGDPGGQNYGWRCYEGNLPYNTNGCAPIAAFTLPVYSYPHNPECSVTGGYIYRGNTASPFYGHYFFADYCSDRIWTLHQVAGNWVKEDFGQFPGNNFSTFGEDVNGQIYIAGITSGSIFRVLEPPATKSLIINAFFEGLYIGGGSMREARNESGLPQWGSGIADKVTIELHNSSNYGSILYSASNVNLSTSGTISLSGSSGIPSYLNGSYYVTLKHRNSIETTTALPISFSGSSINIQLTIPSNVYGANVKLMPGNVHAIYGGDVSQDGLIDSSDVIGIDNDVTAFQTGYIITDVNGDGLIDSTDLILVDNNINAFVEKKTP
jgi:glucose/arabinose dehydrogenase